jgi:hypothetical protein
MQRLDAAGRIDRACCTAVDMYTNLEKPCSRIYRARRTAVDVYTNLEKLAARRYCCDLGGCVTVKIASIQGSRRLTFCSIHMNTCNYAPRAHDCAILIGRRCSTGAWLRATLHRLLYPLRCGKRACSPTSLYTACLYAANIAAPSTGSTNAVSSTTACLRRRQERC